jgi:hypothetical protein
MAVISVPVSLAVSPAQRKAAPDPDPVLGSASLGPQGSQEGVTEGVRRAMGKSGEGGRLGRKIVILAGALAVAKVCAPYGSVPQPPRQPVVIRRGL